MRRRSRSTLACFRGVRSRWLALALASVLLLLPAPTTAQESGDKGDDEAPAQTTEGRPGKDRLELFPDEEPDVTDAELKAEGRDPCTLNEEGNWIDWLNRAVTKSVCGSARWFDSFFATPNEFEERDSTFGRLGLGAYWDEDDGIDPEFRFRGKVNLPHLENRAQFVFGRGDLDEVLDAEDTTSPAEAFFDEEQEWLVGFNYNVGFGSRARLSPSVGVGWSSGVDPYVRLRYIFQQPLKNDRTQYRIKITPQWQDSKGAGYAFRPSLDHTLSDRLLLRYEISIKDFQERFDGYSYGTYLTLFQKLNPKNALKWRVGLVGQSQQPNGPQDIGGSIAWRTTVYKEILVIESTVGTTFRQRPEERSREPELLLGLVVELKFGQ